MAGVFAAVSEIDQESDLILGFCGERLALGQKRNGLTATRPENRPLLQRASAAAA
jgi:hypothetical protein